MCKQKGGQRLGDKQIAAKKFQARVVVKILKRAKEVMRKKKQKQKEMPPTGGSQTGLSENGEVELDSGLANSPEGSLDGACSTPNDFHGGASEFDSQIASDVEDAANDPVEEPPSNPENAEVYMERVRSWQREVSRFGGSVYCEEFRFVNPEGINSAQQVVEAIHRGIQLVLDDINGRVGPDDYVQLRLESRNLTNSLFSVKRTRNELTAEDFLNQTSKLLQSNRELHLDGTLRLVVTVVKNRGGGARRVLNSILNSQIIHKKRQCLVDLTYTGTNLCFAGGLLAVMSDRKPTDAELLAEARKLHEKLGWSDQKKVMLSDVAKFEQHLGVNIQVVLYTAKGGWGVFKTGGTVCPKTYFILLHDEHYYGVLDVKKLFGAKNYCEFCHMVYSHDHSCRYRCHLCLSVTCSDSVGVQQRCPGCRLYCRSKECLDRHIDCASKNQVECLSKTLCEKCQSYVDKRHRCKGRRCKQCQELIVGDVDGHLCFMDRLRKPESSEKYIFYDFECTQETGVHTPNYIFAMSLKPEKSWEFKGDKCLYVFVKTFIGKAFRDYTFLAHNSKGYDAYFIVKQLLKEKMGLELITQGSKLMCVEVKALGIRFIDSLNFLPMKLSKLPQAMGFEGCKGYFPHFFNTLENQNYVGPMPGRKHGVESMMPKEKAEFLDWYRDHSSEVFDLQKELAYYCQQDVKILRQACILYRKEIMKMTEKGDVVEKEPGKFTEIKLCIDPFRYITLASVCMAMYRFMFLEPNTVALLPQDNYHRQKKRYSTPSIQWLLYISHKENIQIRHALQGGELQVGPYFLDGYANVDGVRTAFEFNGCFFHGCVTCYCEKAQNPMTGTSFGFLYYKTQLKTDYLKRLGFVVRTLWEHEWEVMKETDRELADFLNRARLPQPLVPRDALFGGRTNAIRLYYKPNPGEEIHYYDFSSLYPFVNKTKEYPLGHPDIVYDKFGPLANYFGIAKVKVYPPRGLFFPLLPVRVGGKLMFPLCRTCAETEQRETCTHTDEERAILGTWCTVELNAAIAKGYAVAKIYEIWHFNEKSDKLFSEYIKLHLRQKQEASGYPTWCTDEEKQNKYVSDFYQKEGVHLRQHKIRSNPAKCQIAKLFLNSLWGKFGQRSNLPNTSIVRDPNELLQYLFSPNYEVSSCEFIDDETACVSWKHAKERYSVSGNTNVFIACFTTAYARLELYSLLDGLQERCLYHDTDSVIFVKREGDWNPPLGDYLGDLTSEIPPDQHITEFVSAGPKTYGYKLSGGKACMKVKGITLNVANCEKINFDSLKDLVLDYCTGLQENTSKKIEVQQPSIVRNKNQWQIETKTLKKTHKVVYNKRVLGEGFKTLPYGF
ncbi:uncharacterized protein LOC135979895 isoform X1 [Chrysemys picta bellii]|uniref:uncharacterized protein LOC135979895 isoform X1 n=1 Tax=Chrysemys picta bellii TaxID=8478 RepID=UPI0032B1F9C5